MTLSCTRTILRCWRRAGFDQLVDHACPEKHCLFCALKLVFCNLEESEESLVSSNVLREALANAFAEFDVGRMSDASEAHLYILEVHKLCL